MSEPVLTLPELASKAGIDYRVAHTWLRRGLFGAGLKSSAGTGHPNLFTEADLEHLRWLVGLRPYLSIEGLEQANKDPELILAALERS